MSVCLSGKPEYSIMEGRGGGASIYLWIICPFMLIQHVAPVSDRHVEARARGPSSKVTCDMIFPAQTTLCTI